MRMSIANASALWLALSPIPTCTAVHQLSLPELSGKYCVGKTAPLVLTDGERHDLLAPHPNTPRTIVAQCYYPTTKGYKDTCIGDNYATLQFSKWINTFLNATYPSSFFADINTHSCTNAIFSSDCEKDARLLIFSPGIATPRLLYQAVVEDVASHGHIVCALDHPYDSPFVQLPDGTIIGENAILERDSVFNHPIVLKALDQRVADVFFFLKQWKTRHIQIPGAEHTDLSHLADNAAMFGHSFGGALALNVMLKTKSIVAGVNYDGSFWGSTNISSLHDPHTADAKRPYLFMRSDPKNLIPAIADTLGGVKAYIETMKYQTGPKVVPEVYNSSHYSYSDLSSLAGLVSESQRKKYFEGFVGTVEVGKMHVWMCEYTNWFFGKVFSGKVGVIGRGIGGISRKDIGITDVEHYHGP